MSQRGGTHQKSSSLIIYTKTLWNQDQERIPPILISRSQAPKKVSKSIFQAEGRRPQSDQEIIIWPNFISESWTAEAVWRQAAAVGICAIERPPPFALSVMFSRWRKRRLSSPRKRFSHAHLHPPSSSYNTRAVLFNSCRVLGVGRPPHPRLRAKTPDAPRGIALISYPPVIISMLIFCSAASPYFKLPAKPTANLGAGEGLSGAPQRCIQIAGLE
jgi:hypothetical protein